MSRSSVIVAIVMLASVTSGGAAHAERPVLTGHQGQDGLARHAIYAEFTPTYAFFGYTASLDYEYRVGEHFALSTGMTVLEKLPFIFDNTRATYYGGRVIGHVLVGTGDHRLELAAGVSVLMDDDDGMVAPNAAVAWRYQPRDGGFVFRLGAMLSNGVGGPVGLAMGGAF